MTIGHITVLTTDAIKLMARDQADNGIPCEHHFEPGSDQARIFEKAHLERTRELDEHDEG